VQGRRQREQQRRGERESRREGHGAGVHRGGERPRHVRGQLPLEHVQAGPREHQADAGGHQSEQQALGEELPHEAATAGAEGRADGDLAVAALGAGEQEVRDVRAGDEHEEPHGAGEQEKRRPPRPDDLVVEPHGERAELHLGGERSLVRQLPRDPPQVVARTRDRGPGHEARDRVVPGGAGVRTELLGLGGARHPQLRRIGRVLAEVGGQCEAARHHAHDLVGYAVDRHGAP
jgi:hypothetical protein